MGGLKWGGDVVDQCIPGSAGLLSQRLRVMSLGG